MKARHVVGALVVGALTVGSASVSGAGGFSRELVVVPTEVGYDELFEVSGEGCFTAVAFAMPEVPFSARQVATADDGTWSVDMSVPSEAGIPPGPKTITAECLGDILEEIEVSAPSQQAGFAYVDAVVTIVADEPTTPTSAAPTTAQAQAGTASAVPARPAFTG